MGLPEDSLDIETSQPATNKISEPELEEQSTDKETNVIAEDNKDDLERNHEATPVVEEPPQYATKRELSILSTVFTIATFMIAIDGSILGKTLRFLFPTCLVSLLTQLQQLQSQASQATSHGSKMHHGTAAHTC